MRQITHKLLCFLLLFCAVGCASLPALAESSYIYQVNGVNSGVAVKAPVVATTTGSIGLFYNQTIDGVAVNDHTTDNSGKVADRVLVKNQADETQNGIYTVSNTGAWVRSPDMQGINSVVSGSLIYVNGGSQKGFWQLATSDPIVIANSGSSATPSNITFSSVVQTNLDVTANGAVCDGATDDEPAIAAAYAALNGTGALLFPAGKVCAIGENLAAPNGVGTIFEPGGVLKALNTSITFTTGSGAFQAPPLTKIFQGFGTNKITLYTGFSNALAGDCHPEWWGTNDGTHTDDVAINNAIYACQSPQLIGQYGISHEIFVPYGGTNGGNHHMKGFSPQTTIIAYANNINVIHWSDSWGSADNLTLSGGGMSGTSLLRITPTNESSTTVLANQYKNSFSNLSFTSSDESIVFGTGPVVSGTASGCWYNQFFNLQFTNVKRAIWSSCGTAFPRVLQMLQKHVLLLHLTWISCA